jgi:hypothetical protein
MCVCALMYKGMFATLDSPHESNDDKKINKSRPIRWCVNQTIRWST